MGHDQGPRAPQVRLPRFLCEALGAYLAAQAHGPEDLVFRMPQGGPLREAKFLERYVKPAAAADLPATLRVHDLRHTAASLMIRQGATVLAVSTTLGHKSAAMTLDRYGHLWPDDLDALAERLDRAHAAAVTPELSPQRRPEVVQIRKGAGQ